MKPCDVNELQLFDNGLIKVYVTDTGELIVDGRELWEGVGSKQEFANWVKNRLSECDAVENRDFLINISKTSTSGGRPTKEYIVKLGTAKEMAMMEKNEIGKQYRKYLIATEEKYKQGETAQVKPADKDKLLRAEAMLNNSKARVANLYLKIAESVNIPEYKQIMYSKAAETLSGEKALPLPEVERKTYSAEEIGKKLGITGNMVGRIANDNNLKTEQYGKLVEDKAKHCQKQVETFRYYENVVPVIKELLEKKKIKK